MLRFKLLLWVFTRLLNREIKNNSDCAAYVRGKELTFQIQTKDGEGRHFMLRNAKVTSQAGLTRNAAFTMMFCDAARGFSILSAKDSQTAFLRGVGNGDLLLSGDFAEIMWFQGLTDFLQPEKPMHPYERTSTSS